VKKWLKRMLGAVGMGLTWAVGWALVGVLIAVISGSMGVPEESGLDPWMALAAPGFVGGAVFSVVLWLAEGGRKFHELPLPRVAAWGAVAGLVLGVLPFAMVAAGAGSFNVPPWPLAAMIIPPVILLSAVSAAGSALLFRYTARKQPPAGAGLTG
jgi:hypothetical protein